jgi:ketosteroid isomerase-like protein
MERVMRLRRAVVLVCFLSSPALAAAANASTAPSPGIDSARARLLQSFAHKDTSVLRSVLTDDAITWFRQGSGGQANVGAARVLAFYAGLYTNAGQSLEMVFVPGPVTENGAVAFEAGTFRMPAFGTSGSYVTVYHRDADGVWRIAFWKAATS